MGLIGLFLLVSAVIVLFPVVLQVRSGEANGRRVWGYLIFVLGLVLAAFADSTVGAGRETVLAVAGVITALIGLVVQSKLTQKQEKGS